MLPSLPQEIQDEFAHLTHRYGQPLARTIALKTAKRFGPLSKTDRYGEVCMVIRRPNGRLLTMAEPSFYPTDAYRLLTGGINHGEPVFDALLRETREETGLQVEVRRFLAAAEYRLSNADEQPVFYTFAFLLDELGGTLSTSDETVENFREIAPAELPALAEYLEHLGPHYNTEINENWNNWGQFRAAIHHLVWEALQT